MRIAFIHPDLGIGGAEQLVVNLALALQKKDHFVKIYTPHHDPNHCFEDTKNGNLKVEVHGSWFPAHIFGRAIAFCAYVRMMIAAMWVILYGGHYDVFIVDQVSACVPLLRLFRRKVLFYCHFPDKLLCVERRSIFKKAYRLVLDTFEEVTTGCSNMILVNSGFTQGIFQKAFKLLAWFKTKSYILYPATDFSKFDDSGATLEGHPLASKIGGPFFMSLNRYERKKNIALALKAYAEYFKKTPNAKEKLVIAGGYEDRIAENREHLIELKNLAKELNITDNTIFLTNVTNDERKYLLKNALAVLYTPENEHFGIVPVEAMYMERPVIACASGGPLESVADGKTGFLLPTDEKKWAEAMAKLAGNAQNAKDMGKNGKVHVVGKFGLDAFADQADMYVRQITGIKKKE